MDSASKVTLPLALIRPISARISVVFPAPFLPIKPWNAPSFTVKPTSRRMIAGPIATLRSLISSMADLRFLHRNMPRAGDEFADALVGQHLPRRAVGNHGAFIESQDTIGEAGNDLHV